MPRKNRFLVNGGFYHIISRGNDKRNLFHCAKDYEYFLSTIKIYLDRYAISITNYCLMPNHIHLLIHAPEAKYLPKFMQGILQVYAVYFRKRYGAVGFIFQNRYKSYYIDKESYLSECARYIERNPLRSRIIETLLNYPWSSFNFYAQGKGDIIIQKPNPLYLSIADTELKRQQVYYNYLCEERPYDDIVDKEFKIE